MLTMQTAYVQITEEQVEMYLTSLAEKGRASGTLQTYRRCLEHLRQSLPAGQALTQGTLLRWQGQLLAEGYSPSTINTCLSVVNNFLDFLGRRDLQLPRQPGAAGEGGTPELSRGEYLRLLQTARTLGKEKVYLLIKLFALTGLPLQAVPRVTAEAVAAGCVTIPGKGPENTIRLAPCLRRELADFARRQGIAAGPLFCTRKGTPLGRTNISDAIRSLCRDARVSPEKGNPRCLRRLCLETREAIRADLAALAEQTYDRLLEQEQLSVGWEEPYGNPIRKDVLI